MSPLMKKCCFFKSYKIYIYKESSGENTNKTLDVAYIMRYSVGLLLQLMCASSIAYCSDNTHFLTNTHEYFLINISG